MQSKWLEFKNEVVLLRQNGESTRTLEKKFGIPRSTLSGWFKTVVLTKTQREILLKRNRISLLNAQKKATRWHQQQKILRIKKAKENASSVADVIDTSDRNVLELSLALLYLGEGYKKNLLGIGNSNPKILNFFLRSIKILYNINSSGVICELNLRADQDVQKVKKYWSKTLGISLKNFKTVNFDKRTEGSKTYSSYKGVCQLRCANIAVQRRLLFLADIYCDRVVKKGG